MIEKFKEYFEKYSEEKTLIVFKGFSDFDRVDLDQIFLNEFDYFYKNQKKEYFLYDEFLLLKEFLKFRFQKVVIIKNNLYMNYHPLNAILREEYLEELEKNREIIEENIIDNPEIDIQKYLKCYSEVKKIDDEYYVIYNDLYDLEDENLKIEEIEFHRGKLPLKEKKINKDMNLSKILITAEEEYLSFIKKYQNSEEINFIEIADISEIKEKLEIFNFLYPEKIILSSGEEIEKLESKKEVKEILKKYWGFDEFRTLKIYDQDSIEENRKNLKDISQEEIINTIILESEKSFENFGKDVFVTAPTGAGKSVMFQIPAIYLAEKYDKVTIVVSPLIGLMKDQVKGLEERGYTGARTLNSEITLSEKENILQEIEEGKCKILYLSPETLINNSLLEYMFTEDEAKIGLIVIDEAHIVTTWGKQFRADYWYLGNHIDKLRKKYQKKFGHSFIVSSFTATAIYGGLENMYEEIKMSLNMYNPHVYLGMVRRENIDFDVKEVKKVTGKQEYRRDKFESIIKIAKRSLIKKEKCLVYFPTISLIREFGDYCAVKNLDKHYSCYYGTMDKLEKDESLNLFKNGEKKLMAATKAFGMGIDIEDISTVIHFAPTGNLCDYLQEIGRAARKKEIQGSAIYDHMSNDFTYINRFHGLASIKNYQLIEVINKIYSLFENNRKKRNFSKNSRRNEMLVDTEVFSHIFDTNDFLSEDSILNKVKTALLLIQKDFEKTRGFSPFTMRPLPLFSQGYFHINDLDLSKVESKYSYYMEKEKENNYSINLKGIWERKYSTRMSFPQFKYYLYTKNRDEIQDDILCLMDPILKIDVFDKKNSKYSSGEVIGKLDKIITPYVIQGNYFSKEKFSQEIKKEFKVNQLRAEALTDIILSNIDNYSKTTNKTLSGKIIKVRILKNGETNYSFTNNIDSYLKWVEKISNYIEKNQKDQVLYTKEKSKDIIQVLGLLESFGVLNFKSLGGTGGQLYIYVNETKSMLHIKERPEKYKNRMLQTIEERHKLNVKLLSYIYTKNFESEEIWNIVEDYFLGQVPKDLS